MNSLFRGSSIVALSTAVLVGGLTGCAPTTGGDGGHKIASPVASAPSAIDLTDQLQQLEATHSARIGVSAVDTGTGRTISYRADERFGFASTLKAFVAAGFLSAIAAPERGAIATWTQEDLEASGYSPVTSEHLTDGLTLSQLAEAAVRSSDNTATNIVLGKIGGPAGLQQILREAGDEVTNVVNLEPALNVIEQDSADDTTTPAAFAAGLRSFTMGSALDESDQATLLAWMSDNMTGDSLIRAGAPDGWVVADKSGGAYGIRNDIAIVTPPGREPIVVVILTVKNDPAATFEDETVSDTAMAVLEALK